MAGMDSKSREIPLNPVEDVEVFRLGVGFQNIMVRLPDERKKKALSLLREVRKKIYHQQWITNRALVKLIGVLSAARLQYPLASLYLVKLN
jgi:hypothetical protein